MKKYFFILFFALVLASAKADLEVAHSGSDNIVVDWDYSPGYLIPTQSIIPTYVNPGEVINYKAELLRYRPLGILGYPTKYRVEIKNEAGETVTSYTINIPVDVQQKTLSTSDVIFSASFTSPIINGKYYYTGVVLSASGAPHTDFLKDEDTFRVEGDVPVACPAADIDETVSPIPGGQLRIVKQTSYSGSDCIPEVNWYYDAECNPGYEEYGTGSGELCKEVVCNPDFSCPSWDTIDCIADKKTRTCIDVNSCDPSRKEEIQCNSDYIWVKLDGQGQQETEQCSSYNYLNCPVDQCITRPDAGTSKCIKPSSLTEKEFEGIVDDEDANDLWNSVCTVTSQCDSFEGYKVTCTRDIDVRNTLEKQGGLDAFFRDFGEWLGSTEKPNRYCLAEKIGEEKTNKLCSSIEPLGELQEITGDACTDGIILIIGGIVLIIIIFSLLPKK